MRRKQKGEVMVGVVLLWILFMTLVDPRRADCQQTKDCQDFPAKAQAQQR